MAFSVLVEDNKFLGLCFWICVCVLVVFVLVVLGFGSGLVFFKKKKKIWACDFLFLIFFI